MLITIAIPTYNNAKTVSKAIESALKQNTSEAYEILIVNNASKDNTADVISVYKDSKLRIVENPETVDMYSNHNICLKEAKGDYVLFCHSDDALLPNAIDILSERIRLRGCPERYILWGHSAYRDYFYNIQRGGQQVNTMFSGAAAIRSFVGGGLTPSGTCYSRKSLLDLGGFPTTTHRVAEMDWAVLIYTAFNFFEYEMIDRIYFKRLEASTAVGSLSKKDWKDIHLSTYKSLFPLLSDNQRETFLSVILFYGPKDKVCSVKEFIPRKKYYYMRLRRFFSNK